MTTSPERYHQMDALRAFAMLLGVFLHAALSYMRNGLPGWPADAAYHSASFDVFVLWTHSFRMPVFFLMAGFFARLLHARIGEREFIAHRLRRIALPLALGWISLVPLLALLKAWGFQSSSPGEALAANGLLENALTWLGRRPTAHLWFLCYLLFFYVAALALVRLSARLEWKRKLGRADSIFSRLFLSASAPFWLAIPQLAMLLTTKCSIRDVPHGLYPEFGFFCYYGLFFLAGWFLHRNRSLLESMTPGRTALYFLLSIGVLILLAKTISTPDFGAAGHWPWVRNFFLEGFYALLTSLTLFALLGGACRLIRTGNRLIRYIADSSYWVYLVHLPLILALQILLRGSPVPGPLRYWATLAVSLPLLYLSYHYLVRYSAIGVVLHGRRFRNLSS